MIFQFQILGILTLFILTITYYMKWDSSYNKTEYKYLLLQTYISQLLYIATYISIKINYNEVLYAKMYLISILCIFTSLMYYYIINIKQNHLEEKQEKKLNLFFIIMNIFHSVLILISNFDINLYNIDYQRPIFMYFIILYLTISGIILFINIKKIISNKKIHLLIIYFISIISILLQGALSNVAVINSSIVFIVLYLYILVENLDNKKNEQLILEKEYMKKNNINKEDFLRTLSHEIRTPINTIDGFSQMIEECDNIDEIKDDLIDIRGASSELMEVINGMIDLSIIESGELKIINENYDVYDMFDSIVEITKSKLRDKKVDFNVLISKELPQILYGDSERISQIILNVLKNSIKYTDTGSIKLEVSSIKSKSKCRLKINIEDTGRGIKKDELDKILISKFEDKKGLGLSISKHLLDLIGGFIEIESTCGVGTKVDITIDQKIISNERNEKILKRQNKKPLIVNNKRILVVDDNKLNLKVIKKMLSLYKITVEEVNNGEECLELIENDHNFDLILMDDLMPKLSGTDAMNILKKIQRIDGYYIPIVVLTANAVNGQREKYLELGFDDYIAKPIEKGELERVLDKFLNKKD